MVRDIGFEPMMRDSESLALPLGESRLKKHPLSLVRIEVISFTFQL